eukprot:scaffold210723_cov22-Tisochrysis_lutea.AAC.2
MQQVFCSRCLCALLSLHEVDAARLLAEYMCHDGKQEDEAVGLLVRHMCHDGKQEDVAVGLLVRYVCHDNKQKDMSAVACRARAGTCRPAARRMQIRRPTYAQVTHCLCCATAGGATLDPDMEQASRQPSSNVNQDMQAASLA